MSNSQHKDYMVVMVVAFSSLAKILEECLTIYSMPALFLVEISLRHINCSLRARISQQWQSKLR